MKFLIKIVSLIFVLCLPLFANNIATITALKGSATVQNSAGVNSATLGYKLQERDSVVTSEKSKVQIIFKDETIVTVGKNSHFSIKKYLYDEKSEPSVEFSLITGAMRTITGKIGKIAPQRFIVKTKTATIGIRGTNFTVIAMEDGTQRAYCTYGAISVTINQEVNIVRQGFYLALDADNTISVHEFSSKELHEMKNENFGKIKQLEGESSEIIEDFENNIEINEIEEEYKNLTEDDISDAVKNAEQTSDDIGEGLVMFGWGVNNSSYENLATVQFKIFESVATFDSSDSFIAESESDTLQWKYTLKATPDFYTSKNDFAIAFDSVISSNPEYSNYSIDSTKNYLRTTADLSPDDAMSWGEWGVKVNYTETYPGYPSTTTGATTSSFDTSREVDGLWVAGELTDNSVIAGYNQAAVRYEGEYMAYDFSTTSVLVKGAAQLDVNFANDTASLVIMKATDSTAQWASYSMTGADTNHISGSQFNGAGRADGNFYGTTGDSVGGNFIINSGSTSNDAKGVYEVTKIAQ